MLYAPRVGSRHHAAKITEEDVKRMRAARDAGETLDSIHEHQGRALGLSHSSVIRICNRTSWKHVE